MTHVRHIADTAEVAMPARLSIRRASRPREAGQILVIAVISLLSLLSGTALVLEAGNAYAHQREAQNAADAVANAGAIVIAQRLGGTLKTDADVDTAVTDFAASNRLSDIQAWYTDVKGKWLTPLGAVAGNAGDAAVVGDGVIPPLAQGVHVGGSQVFGTGFARVLGFTQFTASAEATAIAGATVGGKFLPVVLPINIVDCSTNGDLGTGEANWLLSDPDPAGGHPIGQKYIVPLCKTGGGSFMILDLDASLGGPMNNCDDEVANPPAIQFEDFPAVVQSDNGNNCAKRMVDEVNALAGEVVLIPICDGECVTSGGSHAEYHIVKVTAFYLDYLSDQNGGINNKCVGDGVTTVTIAGNGSSSCLAGWFVRDITRGAVGAGPVTGTSAISVQLIK